MDKSGNEFDDFCDQLKQMTEVYDNNLRKYKQKYEYLMKRKHQQNLSVKEEEELMNVFRILKSYEEVDEIPAEMLKSSLSDRVDIILGELDDLLKKS